MRVSKSGDFLKWSLARQGGDKPGDKCDDGNVNGIKKVSDRFHGLNKLTVIFLYKKNPIFPIFLFLGRPFFLIVEVSAS